MKPRHILLTCLLTLPTVSALFRPGWYPMQDKMQYFRLYQMDKCLADGQFPCRWVGDLGYGYGYPLFNYYPPLPFYLGMIPVKLGLGYLDSIKILFVLSALLSALAALLLSKNLSVSPPAAVLISTLCAYLPFKAGQIYVRGSLNESFSFVFLPLILAGIFGLFKQPTAAIWKTTLIFGLVGQLLSHVLMLFASLPLIVTSTLTAIYLNHHRPRAIFLLVKPVLLAFGFSAFFVLPMLWESKFVHLESLTTGYFGYLQHFSTLNQILFSNQFGYGSSQLGPADDLPLSVGAALLLTLVLALFKLLTNQSRQFKIAALFLTSTLLVYMFLMHQRSTPIWQFIPTLQFLQFPWRLIVPSSLAAIIIIALNFCFHHRPKFLKLTPLLVILPIFLHGAFFQPQYWLAISDASLLNDPREFSLQQTASIFDYLPKSALAPPSTPAPSRPEIISGLADIITFQKFSARQLLEIKVNSPSARVRFPFFNFPGVLAFVNTTVSPIINDCSFQPFCYGTVSLDLPAGTHTVQLELVDTPVRQVGNIISLVSVGLFVLLCPRQKI